MTIRVESCTIRADGQDQSRILGQHPILTKQDTFYQKRGLKISPPPVQSFNKILQQNKFLLIFHERR